MLIEGTGHAGVGSVLDLSNAAVAKLLGAQVIIVTCGGIGRPIDEVMLNKAVFDSYGVDLLGVIINKVSPEKTEKISRFARLGFQKKGIEVFGIIPFCPVLANPTIRQLMEDIKGELISGEAGLDQSVVKIIVGAMPPHTALDYFKGDVLLITPGNREDLILTALACSVPGTSADYGVKGIILTCGVRPNKSILRLVEGTDIPIIMVNDDTFSTAQNITRLIIKIRPQDKEKIARVKQLIKDHVNIDSIIDKISYFRNASR